MSHTIGDHQFNLETLEDEDGLGYTVYWRGSVSALPLTSWGQGEDRLNREKLPVNFVANTDSPPSPSQQFAFEWLLSHIEEAAARIQAACENSWKECYDWRADEMADDEVHFIEGLRIPPGETSEWVDQPRDPSLPALIVVDLEQDWEIEHGFYVVLDPADPKGDCWTTWDGMAELGLCYEEDEEFDD